MSTNIDLDMNILANNSDAQKRFYDQSLPWILGVIRHIQETNPARFRAAGLEPDDLVNTVWVEMFDNDAAKLRHWQDRGTAKVSTYITKIATRIIQKALSNSLRQIFRDMGFQEKPEDYPWDQNLTDGEHDDGMQRSQYNGGQPDACGCASCTTGLYDWNLSGDGSFSYDDI